MENYIYNETLQGVVDWVNTIFTTLNNIASLEEVYIGWIAYRDVTFSWTTVTFADAPPIGIWQPSIDYFTTLSYSLWGDVTFWEIIDDVYQKIGSKRTSNVILEPQIKKLINKWLQQINNIRKYKSDIFSYSFNKAKDGNAIVYNATQIDVGVIPYVPATGNIILWYNALVPYSSYLLGILSATPWFVYKQSDRVSFGYKIPSWVKRIAEVLMNWTSLKYVDNREFTIDYAASYYTIIKDSIWDEYLFLPYLGTDSLITVKYIPDFSIFDVDSDIVSIEYEYSDVLSLYTAYNILLFREDDRWQAVKQEYLEELKRFKSYKSKEIDWINNTIKSGSLKTI